MIIMTIIDPDLEIQRTTAVSSEAVAPRAKVGAKARKARETRMGMRTRTRSIMSMTKVLKAEAATKIALKKFNSIQAYEHDGDWVV
jgi:hypothetical protein